MRMGVVSNCAYHILGHSTYSTSLGSWCCYSTAVSHLSLGFKVRLRVEGPFQGLGVYRAHVHQSFQFATAFSWKLWPLARSNACIM